MGASKKIKNTAWYKKVCRCWVKVNHVYFFNPEIPGKELRTSGVAVGVSHMHIFGDKHTHIMTKKSLWCTVCMNATSLVTPHAPPSYLVVPRLCRITHSIWGHLRHFSCWLHCSQKEEVKSWCVCPESWPARGSPHLNRLLECVTHYLVPGVRK